jgi:hypothetical protein
MANKMSGKTMKKATDLEVVLRGNVCMYQFDSKTAKGTFKNTKGSIAFELCGNKYVLCLSWNKNTKDWKDKKGRVPAGFISCAICKEED